MGLGGKRARTSGCRGQKVERGNLPRVIRPGTCALARFSLRGAGRKPCASSYARKRLSLTLCLLGGKRSGRCPVWRWDGRGGCRVGGHTEGGRPGAAVGWRAPPPPMGAGTPPPPKLNSSSSPGGAAQGPYPTSAKKLKNQTSFGPEHTGEATGRRVRSKAQPQNKG
jgi:hypothetical protein